MSETPEIVVAGKPKLDSLQRITGALFSPVETFNDIARWPDWLVPLILILLVAIVANVIITPRLDLEGMMREQFEGRKDMSQEKIDSAINMMAKFKGVSAIISVVSTPLVLALVAAVLLIALQMFGGQAKFMQIFSVTLYAWIPVLLQRILLTILIMPRRSVRPDRVAMLLKSNLAGFLPVSKSPVLLTLCSSIDVFYIWSLVLMILGFTAASKLKRGTVTGIVLGVWALAILLAAGLAGIGSLMRG